MTKKDLLEAIEDMPMDAEITKMFHLIQIDVERIVYDKYNNHIVIC